MRLFQEGAEGTKRKSCSKQTSLKGLSHLVCSHANGKWDVLSLSSQIVCYMTQNTKKKKNTKKFLPCDCIYLQNQN